MMVLVRRVRQKDFEFEASLDYRVRTFLKKKKKKLKKILSKNMKTF
jgi:hypothetical protein